MNILESMRDLFRHMEWADATIWRSVLGSDSASTDLLIRSRLHHSHMVQRAFLNAWQKLPHTANAGSDLELNELARWGREYHVMAWKYMRTITEPVLDDSLVLPWAGSMAAHFGHEAAPPSLGETIIQVASHSTYHRGQISTRLRQLGTEPPLTDYIVWIWFGRPLPEWPAGSE